MTVDGFYMILSNLALRNPFLKISQHVPTRDIHHYGYVGDSRTRHSPSSDGRAVDRKIEDWYVCYVIRILNLRHGAGIERYTRFYTRHCEYTYQLKQRQ